jgi:hypothetical protein
VSVSHTAPTQPHASGPYLPCHHSLCQQPCTPGCPVLHAQAAECALSAERGEFGLGPLQLPCPLYKDARPAKTRCGTAPVVSYMCVLVG